MTGAPAHPDEPRDELGELEAWLLEQARVHGEAGRLRAEAQCVRYAEMVRGLIEP